MSLEMTTVPRCISFSMMPPNFRGLMGKDLLVLLVVAGILCLDMLEVRFKPEIRTMSLIVLFMERLLRMKTSSRVTAVESLECSTKSFHMPSWEPLDMVQDWLELAFLVQQDYLQHSLRVWEKLLGISAYKKLCQEATQSLTRSPWQGTWLEH